MLQFFEATMNLAPIGVLCIFGILGNVNVSVFNVSFDNFLLRL